MDSVASDDELSRGQGEKSDEWQVASDKLVGQVEGEKRESGNRDILTTDDSDNTDREGKAPSTNIQAPENNQTSKKRRF